jgi:hypothetical protein
MTIEEARYLIVCPKEVTEKPSANYRIDRSYRRKDFTCSSIDGTHLFKAFIKVNEEFIENFSVGLTYLAKDGTGSLILMRCNGRHGPHAIWPHHNTFHIHFLDEESLVSGVYAERHIEETSEYTNVEEATWYFVNKVGILNPNKYFNQPQGQLF